MAVPKELSSDASSPVKVPRGRPPPHHHRKPNHVIHCNCGVPADFIVDPPVPGMRRSVCHEVCHGKHRHFSWTPICVPYHLCPSISCCTARESVTTMCGWSGHWHLLKRPLQLPLYGHHWTSSKVPCWRSLLPSGSWTTTMWNLDHNCINQTELLQFGWAPLVLWLSCLRWLHRCTCLELPVHPHTLLLPFRTTIHVHVLLVMNLIMGIKYNHIHIHNVLNDMKVSKPLCMWTTMYHSLWL